MDWRKESGVTLLELIIVIALLGMIAAMAAPQLNNVLDDIRLKADAQKMAKVLQNARQEAIASGESRTVYFYSESTKYKERNGKTYWLSPGISFKYVDCSYPLDGKPAFVFSASGSPSSCGTVYLRDRQGNVLHVIVSMWAGRIRISESPPKK